MPENSPSSLASRFERLLPEIYYKLIVEGYTHKACAEWLRDEKGLNLLRPHKTKKDVTTSLFSNYLRAYGNIRKAKLNYDTQVVVAQPAHENFWKLTKDNVNLTLQDKLLSSDHDNVTLDKETINHVDDDLVALVVDDEINDKKVKSANIFLAEKLGLEPDPTKNQFSEIDPMAGYSPHSTKRHIS